MKKFVFNAWVFVTLAFFTLIGIRFFAPDVFWDIINAGLSIMDKLAGIIT